MASKYMVKLKAGKTEELNFTWYNYISGVLINNLEDEDPTGTARKVREMWVEREKGVHKKQESLDGYQAFKSNWGPGGEMRKRIKSGGLRKTVLKNEI